MARRSMPRGGWHDAGDLLKYLLTSGNATAQMLLAYRLGPKTIFPDVRRSAPGFGMDAETSSGARSTLSPNRDDRDHAGWRLPQNETVDYGWGKGGARPVYFADGKPQGLKQYQSASTGVANLAGRYAAAMGLAYQIWKDTPQQRSFAARCRKAGLEVYELGRAKEGVQQGNVSYAPVSLRRNHLGRRHGVGATELFAPPARSGFEDAKRYAKLAADEGWMGKGRRALPVLPVHEHRPLPALRSRGRGVSKLLAGIIAPALSVASRPASAILSRRRAVHLVFQQSAHGAGDAVPDV